MKRPRNIHLEVYLPLLLIALLAISQIQSIEKLLHRWNTGDNNYCFLIFPLFAYLCWDLRVRGKNGFKFGEFSWNSWGLLIVLVAMLVLLMGELGSVETILYGGLWLTIVGLAILLYGRRVLFIAFPLIILAFMVPLPPFINRILTFKLKMVATTLAVKMMRLIDISVLQTGNIIDLGVDKLQVVDACSGLRYFMPMVLLSLLVGHLFNRRLWHRVILVAVVPPLSVFVNGFRIFLSGWLTVNGHRELAQNFFHDFSGWLVFMVAGGILLGIALLLRRIGDEPAPQPMVDPAYDASSGQFKPVLLTAIACTFFLMSGFGIRNIPSATNLPDRWELASFPMNIASWEGQRHYLEQDVLNLLSADDYVNAVYANHDSGNRIQLLIPFYAYQGTRHTAHAPQSCLLGGGFDLLRTEERKVSVKNGGNLRVMTLLLKQGDTRVLGSYFFFERGRVITSPWMNKAYLMWDAITKRRTDGALVRAELIMKPGQSEEEAFQILSEFLSEVWEILPEYVPV